MARIEEELSKLPPKFSPPKAKQSTSKPRPKTAIIRESVKDMAKKDAAKRNTLVRDESSNERKKSQPR